MFEKLIKYFTSLIPHKNLKTGEEEKECIKFAFEVRQLIREKRFNGIFLHIPNEYGGNSQPLYGHKLNLMGRFPGAADYLIVARQKNTPVPITLFIEFKARGKKLRKTQELFQWWCQMVGVDYHICYTKQEAIKILENYNFIID